VKRNWKIPKRTISFRWAIPFAENEEGSLLIESPGINDEHIDGEIQERILPALVIRVVITTGVKYTIKYVAKASQLQSKNKHAGDFGVTGNYNLINRGLYENVLRNHVDDATEIYLSKYSGSDVFVFLKDGNLVYTDLDGEFISGWKHTDAQAKYHRENGKKASKQ